MISAFKVKVTPCLKSVDVHLLELYPPSSSSASSNYFERDQLVQDIEGGSDFESPLILKVMENRVIYFPDRYAHLAADYSSRCTRCKYSYRCHSSESPIEPTPSGPSSMSAPSESSIAYTPSEYSVRSTSSESSARSTPFKSSIELKPSESPTGSTPSESFITSTPLNPSEHS